MKSTKEKPILFSTPMVQSILSGRKTMTRRFVKPRPDLDSEPSLIVRGLANERDWGKWYYDSPEGETIVRGCPYGQPGDILWVRETQAKIFTPDGEFSHYAYKADNDPLHAGIKWKQSIFMPRKACRIRLVITEVRVERLQDISEEDTVNEGIDSWVEERLLSKPTRYKCYADFDNPKDPATYCSNPVDSFQSLWQSINGAESWDANPWVWVIAFKKTDSFLSE